MRVLIVEDEGALRAQLQAALQAAGYAVDAAANGTDALHLGRVNAYDVAVLDLGLPDMDGVRVLRGWRGEARVFPVLILTARGRWQDKVEGLEAGADDYLVKPFQLEELLARLRALLRRAAGHAASVIVCGPITLDTMRQSVRLDDTALELTGHEYRLLEYLVLNAGKVLSKTELTEHLYDEESDRDSNVIEVFVGRLRRKLDPRETLNPIETLRGRGYRFTLECRSA